MMRTSSRATGSGREAQRAANHSGWGPGQLQKALQARPICTRSATHFAHIGGAHDTGLRPRMTLYPSVLGRAIWESGHLPLDHAKAHLKATAGTP